MNARQAKKTEHTSRENGLGDPCSGGPWQLGLILRAMIG
jgi:hypothetical protein